MKLFPARSPSPLRYSFDDESSAASAAKLTESRPSKSRREKDLNEFSQPLIAQRRFLSSKFSGEMRDHFFVEDLIEHPQQSETVKRGYLRDGLTIKWAHQSDPNDGSNITLRIRIIKAASLHKDWSIPAALHDSDKTHAQLLTAMSEESKSVVTAALVELQSWHVQVEPAMTFRSGLEQLVQMVYPSGTTSNADKPLSRSQIDLLLHQAKDFEGILLSLPGRTRPLFILPNPDLFRTRLDNTKRVAEFANDNVRGLMRPRKAIFF